MQTDGKWLFVLCNSIFYTVAILHGGCYTPVSSSIFPTFYIVDTKWRPEIRDQDMWITVAEKLNTKMSCCTYLISNMAILHHLNYKYWVIQHFVLITKIYVLSHWFGEGWWHPSVCLSLCVSDLEKVPVGWFSRTARLSERFLKVERRKFPHSWIPHWQLRRVISGKWTEMVCCCADCRTTCFQKSLFVSE